MCESVKRADSDVPPLSADHMQKLHLICTSALIWKLAEFSFPFRKDSVNTVCVEHCISLLPIFWLTHTSTMYSLNVAESAEL